MKNYLSAFVILSLTLIQSCTKDSDGNVTEVVPIPPVDLTATVISANQVDLAWTDKSTNESGFKIQRKTGTQTFADIGTTGKDVTIYSDKGLTAGTTYTYRVYSYNNTGASPTYSNEVTVATNDLATLTTLAVSNVIEDRATSGGNITSDGGSPITQRGICWSTTPNPTTANNIVLSGTGIGNFTTNLTGLNPNTTYYVRAFAINSAGTAYGNELSFTMPSWIITELLVNGNPMSGNYTLFSFDEGKEVSFLDSNSVKWDFGLRFETFIINSNASGPGSAYVQTLQKPFNEILEAPLSGYKYDTTTAQKAIKGSDWYNYNPTTRQFSPKAGITFVFVTAIGKYAKMEVLSSIPSDYSGNPVVPPTRPTKIKYTIRYFYQRNGTTTLQ
jgi:hypothetical protein